MLKLKDTPVQSVALTTEALEARVDELEFEKLQSETEQLMVSAEGYRNIGTVLNSTGVLSLEAAALAEVAEQLIGGGSSNLSAGLESHVVSGLEAEGKGEGFMAKAKEIGAKIAEKIRKLFTWIMEKIGTNLVEKSAKLKKKIDAFATKDLNITEAAKRGGDEAIDNIKNAEVESPSYQLSCSKYLADLINNTESKDLIRFMSAAGNLHISASDVTEESWDSLLDTLSKQFHILSDKTESLSTGGIDLTKLPSSSNITLLMEGGTGQLFARKRLKEDATVKVNLSSVIDALNSSVPVINSINKMGTANANKLKQIKDSLSSNPDVDQKLLLSLMSALRYIYLDIPTIALNTYYEILSLSETAK